MIKTIAIVVVVLLVVSLAGVLLLAVSKPDTFRVQRATGVKLRRTGSFRSSPISTAGAPGRPTRNWTPR